MALLPLALSIFLSLMLASLAAVAAELAARGKTAIVPPAGENVPGAGQ